MCIATDRGLWSEPVLLLELVVLVLLCLALLWGSEVGELAGLAALVSPVMSEPPFLTSSP